MPQLGVTSNPTNIAESIGQGFNSALGPAAGVIQAVLIFAVLIGALLFVLQKIKYNTKVILIRERKSGTEYVLTKAKRDFIKNVYIVKMKGIEKPRSRRIPLPNSGELIAKSGKNDLIALRELPTGELRYCTHPDVSNVSFKTLSSDYRQFIILDEEETRKRVTKLTFWTEHGSQIIQVAGIALFFILCIMLLDKFQDVQTAAGSIVAQMKQLSCAQVITG